jgi:succinate dehydrogenase/fumarate reductase cytochrome b subunit
MRTDLIAACEMFLVPSTIMFAALGIAGSEGLKTLVSAMGIVTSSIWWTTVNGWDGLLAAEARPALWLSGLFVLAWTLCFFTHLVYGLRFGFERQREVLNVACVTATPPGVTQA